MKFRISDSKAKQEFEQKGLQISFHYTNANEKGLHYVKSGSDTLPTLFFVHGSPGSWDAFKNIHDGYCFAAAFQNNFY